MTDTSKDHGRRFAVYSPNGVHIGLWRDGKVAADVQAETVGNTVEELVLATERDALAARLEETECNLKNLQDRIEVKGGSADAPTQWAYEQACAALHRHKERAGVKDQQLHIARESLLNIAKCADDEDPQETAKNALVIMRALEADE